MHLLTLTIRKFRNIENLQWRPAPGLNLIWGENGQGKTNLLEAVAMAMTGRSFRTRRDEECLPWDQPQNPAAPTLAQVEIQRRLGRRALRLVLGHESKRAFIEGRLAPRLADLWAEGAAVVFTPESVDLFKGPPAARRRLLDMTLAQVSPSYLDRLRRYQATLRQLNAALRSPQPEPQVREAAQAFYPLLADDGAALVAARAQRLADASGPLAERFAALGGAGLLALRYLPNLKDQAPEPAGAGESLLRERLLNKLHDRHADSRRWGGCVAGPHRDDFTALLEGRDLRRYGSQGQHRLAALTLKLEAARWIEDALDDPPILLLDDFGSELDPRRRAAVLEGLRGRMQVLLTATHPEDLGGPGLFDRTCQVAGGALLDPAEP